MSARSVVQDLFPRIVEDDPVVVTGSRPLDQEDASHLRATAGMVPLNAKATGAMATDTTDPPRTVGMTADAALATSLSEDPRVMVFVSTVSGNLKTKKHQQYVFNMLDVMKIPYEWVDIASDAVARGYLVRRLGKQLELPQLFLGEKHLGGYDAFQEAIENGSLEEDFLQLTPVEMDALRAAQARRPPTENTMCPPCF